MRPRFFPIFVILNLVIFMAYASGTNNEERISELKKPRFISADFAGEVQGSTIIQDERYRVMISNYTSAPMTVDVLPFSVGGDTDVIPFGLSVEIELKDEALGQRIVTHNPYSNKLSNGSFYFSDGYLLSLGQGSTYYSPWYSISDLFSSIDDTDIESSQIIRFRIICEVRINGHDEKILLTSEWRQASATFTNRFRFQKSK